MDYYEVDPQKLHKAMYCGDYVGDDVWKRDGVFATFDLTPRMKWNRFKPQNRFKDENRRDTYNRALKYDAPRIVYFRNRFLNGLKVKPIIAGVDYKGGWDIYDGYHRFCGALLAKAPSILIEWDHEQIPTEQELVYLKSIAPKRKR